MKLAIVIVNYNTPLDTLECLASLKKATLPKGLILETTLVDNASSDDSVELIKKKYPEIKLIISLQNLGFAGGNNLGIKAAMSEKPDWIMLLNSDTLVDKTFFQELQKGSVNDPQVGALSPLIYFASGFEFHRDRYKKKDLGKVIWYGGGQMDWANVYGTHKYVDQVDKGQVSQAVETDFATGACLIVRAKVFQAVGLLNEDYFLYLEDLEFNQRVKLADWKVMIDPGPKIWHKVSRSSGGIGSPLNEYFITRNRLNFGMRYAPWRTKIALVREAVKQLMVGTQIQKLAIKDFLIGRYGKGSYLK